MTAAPDPYRDHVLLIYRRRRNLRFVLIASITIWTIVFGALVLSGVL